MLIPHVASSWPALHLEKRPPRHRVLIVEDSPTQASEMQHLLEQAGFLADYVHDGQGALARIRAVPPDVVVTDMIMAGMGGIQLIEAIRRDFPWLPVVLVTAFGSERVAGQALRAGAASFVPKRDVHDDLVPTLRDLLAISLRRSDQRTALGCLARMEAHFDLENDPSLVAPLVRHLEEVLAAMRFGDPASLIHVGVALHEALVNAIVRGNLEIGPEPGQDDEVDRRQLVERRFQESPYRDRRVHLTAKISPSEVVYIVQDEGPGFDLARVLDSDDCDLEGGRGLFLIRTFMDEISQDAGRNTITLVKRCEPGRACA